MGLTVAVPDLEGQQIDVQVVQHIFDGDPAMELLKHQKLLVDVGFKADTIPVSIISNAADLLQVICSKDTPGLSGATSSVEVGDLQYSLF